MYKKYFTVSLAVLHMGVTIFATNECICKTKAYFLQFSITQSSAHIPCCDEIEREAGGGGSNEVMPGQLAYMTHYFICVLFL